MTFGESCLPPLEIERFIVFSRPKPTLWSAKIMVRVIEKKIFSVRDLLGCRAIEHDTCIGYVHEKRMGHAQATCTGITQATCMGIARGQ